MRGKARILDGGEYQKLLTGEFRDERLGKIACAVEVGRDRLKEFSGERDGAGLDALQGLR